MQLSESGIILPPTRPKWILFEKDWNYFPTAQPDYDTKNESFVMLAKKYQMMGIKNHRFHLALINPRLRGIDPHDPEVLKSTEIMAAIMMECISNPWYFFREVAKAPAQAGDKPGFVEANRGNISLFWSFFNHATYILIQIRQTGKSFSSDILMTYLLHVVCKDTTINLLTKDDRLRRDNIERLKNIAADLPPYVNRITKNDVNNGEEISINALGNKYKTLLPQMSPKRALNVGRGLTTPIFQIDEAPFQPNIAISLPAALTATSAAIDRARRAGSPYGIILTTTAGKKDDKDGEFIYNMVCDAATWDEKFFDCYDEEELRKVVTKASRSKDYMINGTFNHRQLGKTDEWLKEKLRTTRQSGDDANRDYFNMWTSGSQSSPFTPEQAAIISGSKMEPHYKNISQPAGYMTNWFVPENQIEFRAKNCQMVLGIDPSDAGGGDATSFVLIDCETLETVATALINETNLMDLASWICEFMIAFPKTTMIPENRSMGQLLIDYLLKMLPMHGIDPFKRIFNRIVNDHVLFPDRYREIQVPMARRPSDIYDRYKKLFGFATSGTGLTSRDGLYSATLHNAVKRAGHLIRCKNITEQLLALIVKNGRVNHPAGGHDDMVIGWLLANWLITQGTNLTHYGIDVSLLMSNVSKKTDETPQEKQFRETQARLRERMAELMEDLSNEVDDYACLRLEYDLRKLDRQIVQEENSVFSMDELIAKATEARRNKLRRGVVQSSNRYYEEVYGGTQTQISDLPPGLQSYGYRR